MGEKKRRYPEVLAILDPSNEPDPRIVAFLAAAEKLALWGVALITGVIFVLWLVPGAARLAPVGWSDMTVHTAVGLALAAGALALWRPGASRLARSVGRLAAWTTLVIGLVVMVFNEFGVSTVADGRLDLPSPQTAGALVFAGAAIILLQRRSGFIADLATIGFWSALLFLLGGHIFQAAELVAADDGRLMSLHTLLCFYLIAFVVSSRLAGHDSIFSTIVSAGLGSRMLRSIAGLVLVAPFLVFAVVTYLHESELVTRSFTTAVFASAIVIAVFAIVGRMALRINTLERSLHMQSVTDELTGILNRRGFGAVGSYVVAAAQREQEPLSVFFFDVDDLKRVNDDLGHDAGSELLQRFAGHLTATFRKADVIARMGGDEFAILMEGDRLCADKAAKRFQKAVAAGDQRVAAPHAISYSVGFTELDPDTHDSLGEALAIADGLMYEQKRAGRLGLPERATTPGRTQDPAGAEPATAT